MHTGRKTTTTPQTRPNCIQPPAQTQSRTPWIQRQTALPAPPCRPAAAHGSRAQGLPRERASGLQQPPAQAARAGATPPAYRPQPTPVVLQPKSAPARPTPPPARVPAQAAGAVHRHTATPQPLRPQPFGGAGHVPVAGRTPPLKKETSGVRAARPFAPNAAHTFGVQRKTAVPGAQAPAAHGAAPRAPVTNASRGQVPPSIQRPQPSAGSAAAHASRPSVCVQRSAALRTNGVIQPMMDDGGMNLESDLLFDYDPFNYGTRGKKMVQDFEVQSNKAVNNLKYMFDDGRNLSGTQLQRIYTATHGSISTMMGYFNEFELMARKLHRKGNVTPQVHKTDMEYTDNGTGITTRLEAKNINTGAVDDIGKRLKDADVQHGNRGLPPMNTHRKTYIRITAPSYDYNSWPYTSSPSAWGSSFGNNYEYNSFVSVATRNIKAQNLQNTDKITIHGADHGGTKYKARFRRNGNDWNLVGHTQL